MLNEILQIIGFYPIKETQKQVIYTSPFNPTERTPSFCVFQNSNSGEWTNFKDYSSDKGGDYYDFIMEYFHIDFKSAKQKLQDLIGGNYQEPKRPTPIKAPLSSFNQLKKSYEIKKVQLLQNRALIEYLREDRKISYEVANRYISEVYYEMNDKNYFALCFYNDSGGMETRNKYKKLSLGKKDISIVAPYPNQKRVKIFEGFLDFISYIELNEFMPKSDYLVLNSISLLDRAFSAINGKYEAYELYLDNDRAGDEATQDIIKKINDKEVIDKRNNYKIYKDLNEFLIAKKG